MNRDSAIIEQECFSYGINRPEVQFVPNPSSRSSQRLLTPMYTNEENQDTSNNHHYEDPARLAQQSLTREHVGPRKKTNDLYEMSIPLQSLNKVKRGVRSMSRSSDDSDTGYTYPRREPLCHRVILYLVLLLSLTATVLVILMIAGMVGPKCHCGNGTTDSKETSSQRQSFSEKPLQEAITSLKSNLSRMEMLLVSRKYGYVIIGPFCSTIGAKEYNLEVYIPRSGGNPNYECTCKGESTLFPPQQDPDNPGNSDKKVMCILHYWLCPNTT
ncbi:uncharacterized protein LOC116289373 [Actinia tenebrosa]|uniref:Uncharacterized protein LOC116289373 n=1 Tax=Actinia tenebrosa TaxID=6105 RepID=A0A6P8HHT5_ACTTE|nr:uncharacterized protein LOC116289373 [Actinia tenebrosa]